MNQANLLNQREHVKTMMSHVPLWVSTYYYTGLRIHMALVASAIRSVESRKVGLHVSTLSLLGLIFIHPASLLWPRTEDYVTIAH